MTPTPKERSTVRKVKKTQNRLLRKSGRADRQMEKKILEKKQRNMKTLKEPLTRNTTLERQTVRKMKKIVTSSHTK